ncbi:MAG: cysteine desulfurase [Bacteroidota bacterium]|nr:cysteine desulfurase [Bacteroidota bacterium]MDW8138339.1 cysteine desulfurase [Bacteroidota bacterium]
MLDVERIREDFPLLTHPPGGKPLAYLDNAATTQKPRSVLEAIERFYTTQNANVHRGAYALAEAATEAYERARRRVADFIGAPGPEAIIFTRNTTEAINLVAYSWGLSRLKPGDEILLTEMEHHANLVPWHLVAERTGARIRAVPLREDLQLDWDAFLQLLSPRTRIVAVTHVSNVLGTVNPISEIVRVAHACGAVVLVDGAQAVPHCRVNVRELEVDFYAFSGHKMCGPTGIGVLYGRPELLEAMPPFLGGGDMINEVWIDRSTYAELPHKFEAGTPHMAGAVGLEAAIAYLEAIGLEAIGSWSCALADRAAEALGQIPGVRVYRPKAGSGVVSFVLAGVHAHDLATVLDCEGVAVRAGHHCAQPLMRRLGLEATTRASFYFYNTDSELELLLEAVRKAAQLFSPLVERELKASARA